MHRTSAIKLLLTMLMTALCYGIVNVVRADTYDIRGKDNILQQQPTPTPQITPQILGLDLLTFNNIRRVVDLYVIDGYITGKPYGLHFTADNSLIASAKATNIYLWSPETLGKPAILTGTSDDKMRDFALSPNGSYAASTRDNTVVLWNVKSKQREATLDGHTGAVNSVIFSKDGTLLLSGSNDNTVRVWDVENGKQIRQQRHKANVNSIAISMNNQTVAFGGEGNLISLWNIETDAVQVLEGYTPPATNNRSRRAAKINELAFSPDGKFLAVAYFNNVAELWNIEKETARKIRVLQGHTNSIPSIAFNADGKLLATGSVDNTVKIWNGQNGGLLATIKQESTVQSVSFSTDNTRLVIADNNRIHFWGVPSVKPDGQFGLRKIGDKSKYIDQIPSSWFAKETTIPRFLIEVQESSYELESCPYTSDYKNFYYIERIQYRVIAKLTNFRTQTVAASRTFLGERPDYCPAKESFARWESVKKYKGKIVPLKDVYDWIESMLTAQRMELPK